jgi:hypothetical protein
MLSTDKPRIIMHPGDIIGYTSVITRFPDDKVTVIILTNQQNIDPLLIGDIVTKKLFGK